MATIPLTKGRVAIVDDADAALVSAYNWRAKWDRRSRSWRALVAGYGDLREMSVVILGVRPGLQIDHRNHDTLDNRRQNLRFCTAAENACNRRKRRGTKYPVKGIFLNGRKFTLRLVIEGRRRVIGHFATLEEAAAAYNHAARQAYGEFFQPT